MHLMRYDLITVAYTKKYFLMWLLPSVGHTHMNNHTSDPPPDHTAQHHCIVYSTQSTHVIAVREQTTQGRENASKLQ